MAFDQPPCRVLGLEQRRRRIRPEPVDDDPVPSLFLEYVGGKLTHEAPEGEAGPIGVGEVAKRPTTAGAGSRGVAGGPA